MTWVQTASGWMCAERPHDTLRLSSTPDPAGVRASEARAQQRMTRSGRRPSAGLGSTPLPSAVGRSGQHSPAPAVHRRARHLLGSSTTRARQRGQVKPPAPRRHSAPRKATPSTPSALRCGKPMRTCARAPRRWPRGPPACMAATRACSSVCPIPIPICLLAHKSLLPSRPRAAS
jgi:hypothetical protein